MGTSENTGYNMTIVKKLEKFVTNAFQTTLEVFLEALKLSPNAQGYVRGSVTELLLKKHLEALGYTVERIKEKWGGKKHPNHHGDFYVKDKTGNWYVLESKGIKSNAEKWHKLYNYDKLKSFLYIHRDKISWINQDDKSEQDIDQWIKKYLPKFLNEYNLSLYNYDEVGKYQQPTTPNKKSKSISKLRGKSREEIDSLIDERLAYLMGQIKVLETHFVSGVGANNERTQATPRKDEFSVLSVDIALRLKEHKFYFANPYHLDSSVSDVNHLQQNYVMGFIFHNTDLCITDEWNEEFDEILQTVDRESLIEEADMQIDYRKVSYENEEC